MSNFDKERPVVDVLADLIAHLHVPRSLGSVMVPPEYDELRWLIGDTGWSTPDEIAARLRARLEYEGAEQVASHAPNTENEESA